MPSGSTAPAYSMRAVVKDRHGVCTVADMPVPKPGAREVLIAVEAASVNRADWAVGKPLRVGEPSGRFSIPCSDVAGVVRACGAGVTRLKPGDVVCAETKGFGGGLAEYALAREAWCARLPQGMSWELASTLPTAGVTGLAAAEKTSGNRVLVVGAGGGVGQFVLAFAAQAGYEAYAVCGCAGLGDALALGARQAFDYAGGLAQVPGLFDSVVAVNGRYPVSEYLRLLAPGGSIVLVGADSLSPSMLLAPFKGAHLRVATFFSRIGKGGLQQVCDLVASSGIEPRIERVEGLDAGLVRIVGLAQEHPHGKLVICIY